MDVVQKLLDAANIVSGLAAVGGVLGWGAGVIWRFLLLYPSPSGSFMVPAFSAHWDSWLPSSISCCETLMGVSMETRRRRKELIPTKSPTARERALYFLAAPVIGLVILAPTLIFDWSKATMLVVVLAVGSIYVLVATPLLLGRRADR